MVWWRRRGGRGLEGWFYVPSIPMGERDVEVTPYRDVLMTHYCRLEGKAHDTIPAFTFSFRKKRQGHMHRRSSDFERVGKKSEEEEGKKERES
jgi:hypothetical protein